MTTVLGFQLGRKKDKVVFMQDLYQKKPNTSYFLEITVSTQWGREIKQNM